MPNNRFTLEPLPIEKLPPPPKDVELLARYFYKYKCQLVPTLKNKAQCLETSPYFATIPNGLRSFFVQNNKMSEFHSMRNDSSPLQEFFKHSFGFSLYMTDGYWIKMYLHSVADKLNHYYYKNISDIRCAIFHEGASHINTLKNVSEQLDFTHFQNHLTKYSSTLPDDPTPFLYDLLFQHKELAQLHQSAKSNVDAFIQSQNFSNRNTPDIVAILYTVIFYILYQLDNKFWTNWKMYYSLKDRQQRNPKNKNKNKYDPRYRELKKFAYTIGRKVIAKIDTTDKNKDNNDIDNDYLKYYIYLIFIERIYTKYLNHISPKETFSMFYIRHISGKTVFSSTISGIPEIFGYSGGELDIHRVIDTFKYIDQSEGLLRSKNRFSRFNNYHELPLKIYALLIKSWIYYSNINPEKFNEEHAIAIKKHFSYHFFNEYTYTYLDKYAQSTNRGKLKATELCHYFSSSANGFNANLRNHFYEYFQRGNNKSTTSIHRDFFEGFFEYSFSKLKNLRELAQLSRDTNENSDLHLELYHKILYHLDKKHFDDSTYYKTESIKKFEKFLSAN